MHDIPAVTVGIFRGRKVHNGKVKRPTSRAESAREMGHPRTRAMDWTVIVSSNEAQHILI